jgi:4-alpha-glucanotransferase
MPETPSDELRELARSYGVQLEYVGMDGKTRPAPAESLLAVLRALGAEVGSEADVPLALIARQAALWNRRVEPVLVAWDGILPWIGVRVPEGLLASTVRCRIEIEAGVLRQWKASVLPPKASSTHEGFSTARVDLAPGPFPTGYHWLELDFEDGQTFRSMVISAPTRAYQGPDSSGKRLWGVFCPLYALHRDSSWGAGDFSDLEALIDWTAGQGGGLVATLPMLASSFDGFSPIISPYSPTSRVFWNEFYLDLGRIPELADSRAVRDLLASDEARREVAELRASGLVDYGRQMSLKRQVLEHLASELERADGERGEAFRAFIREHPEVESYALFQAAGEKLGRDWRGWPSTLDRSQVDRRAYRYHIYAQWQADEQLKTLSSKAREKGLVWYLDFPIGVDFNSFDVWTHRDTFATGASVGCPPDPVFTRGQNWGFPPLHPDRQRESGYAYLIASIRSHLKYANALRMDHVMGLHRLFWIPQGMEAKFGAFVSTPAEEIYAILSVESHRHSAWLVGEDLGTVPPEVEGAMKRHNVRGMYVVQYELRPDDNNPLREVPETTVASVNTHDMPPFAAFWGGLDLDDRKDLGLMSGETLEHERRVREEQRSALVNFFQHAGYLEDQAAEDPMAVLQALWRWLAASPSSVLLLNLEDLWLETEPQNTPNTYDERPNWRRKLRRSFEQFADDPAVLAILKQVDELRAMPARPGSIDGR